MTVKALKKQLMAAIAMVVVSAIALSSSTYAWFASNNTVTAQNMSVTATSEAGIVIGAYTNNNVTPPTDNAFKSVENALISAMEAMLPTYTADAEHWYHSNSTETANGQAYVAAGYTSVNNVVGVDADGNGSFNDVGDTVPVNYYLFNKFQIKAMGGTKDVYVKEITYTGGTQAYDPSIRVLVKSGDATLIFAPIGSHTGTEGISADTATGDAVEADVSFTFATVNKLASKILDDVGETPADVSIYVYYDGEDPACKSDNITTFADTNLTVTFTSDTPAD